MNRYTGIAIGLLAIASCRGREAPLPRADTVTAVPLVWALDAPQHWTDRVELEDGAPAHGERAVQHFVYHPADTSLKATALVSVLTYDASAWLTQRSPQSGDSLASDATQVLTTRVATDNPYPPGSVDFRTFESLKVDVALVRQSFRVIR